jgi:cytochrome c551/c552
VKASRAKSAAVALISTVLVLPVAFHLCSLHGIVAGAKEQGEDGPPVVKITAPKANSAYRWNTLVNYSIVVSYQGKSTQYQEIPANEVLLKTTYVPDLSSLTGKPATAAAATPAGVVNITHSKCLGCHDFKAKAMGPSFAAIGQRYPESQVAIDMLSQHIRKGITGLWGQESMPAQPDLTEDQVHAIVLWITKEAANPNVNYYVGAEGTFRMESVGAPDAKGGTILTASYTSPTPAATSEQAPHGEDTVIVGGK